MEDIRKLGLVSLETSELQTRGGVDYDVVKKIASFIEALFTIINNYIPDFVKGFKAGFNRGNK